MIRVLSIGNSFSEDAQRYLHGIARREGAELKCVNLYIGGCSLYTHYINMLEDKRAYHMMLNGAWSGFYVGIKEALASDHWDFITLQQASRLSPDYDSYQPYIGKLAELVRLYAPKAKLLLHETWAYEQGSERLGETVPYTDHRLMFADIEKAYAAAAAEIGADGIIPSGKAMLAAAEANLGRVHADGAHADRGISRYLLALIWYMTLTGKKAEKLFDDFDVDVDMEKVKTVKKIAEEIVFGN